MLATDRVGWRQLEGHGRGSGLYLQSNFNGENGSKNNIKIKQNLQNKKKQGGDGWGWEGQQMSTKKGITLQNHRTWHWACAETEMS